MHERGTLIKIRSENERDTAVQEPTPTGLESSEFFMLLHDASAILLEILTQLIKSHDPAHCVFITSSTPCLQHLSASGP